MKGLNVEVSDRLHKSPWKGIVVSDPSHIVEEGTPSWYVIVLQENGELCSVDIDYLTVTSMNLPFSLK